MRLRSGHQSDRAVPRPRRTVSAWLAGFLLIFGLLAAWSLATPKYAAPDEPAHAYRAASLVRGQILGAGVTPTGANVHVTVPATLTAYGPHCFTFKDYVAASCEPAWVDHPGMFAASSYTGRYPPLYSFIVGLPTLLTTGASVLLWMRLAGDLINAIFLTAALFIAARRSPWLLAGCAVAVTPTALFFGSVVNPSGLEICSAVTLWSALLALVSAPAGSSTRSLVVWAAVSAAVFESVRGLSPALMAITVVVVAALAGRSRLRELARQHDVRVAVAVVVAVGLVAAGWIVFAHALRLTGGPVPGNYTFGKIVQQALKKSLDLNQLIGRFGWLDTPSPNWVLRLWVVAVAVMVVGMAVNRAGRGLVVVVCVIVACVVLPAAGDVQHARTVGLVAQGRYILPLAVGVPMLAGACIRHTGLTAQLAARIVMGAIGVGQVADFLRALIRYRTGLNAPTPPPDGVWSPPLGAAVLITVFVVAIVGQQVWFWMLLRRSLRPASGVADQSRRAEQAAVSQPDPAS